MVDVVMIKVSEYVLDNEQEEIVLSECKYILVSAGAGSGKTKALLALSESKNIAILCENEARAIATKRMVNEASCLGADAIVNVRYASSAIMQGAAEVIVYGTAVKFVK